MQQYYLSPTSITPEINFSPKNNIFFIRGISAPEDVRSIYYPAIGWINQYIDTVIKGNDNTYSSDNPLKLQVDLEYFNSSSAKFLYDIFLEIKRGMLAGIPVKVEWFHDEEDQDLREAGSDIALLAEMEFTYIAKQ